MPWKNGQEASSIYLAIDPGDSTGWATFNYDTGETLGFGKIKGHDAFLDWLEEIEGIKTIILENYKVGRSGGSQFTHSFSDVPTLQLIGAIRRVAKKRHWTIVEQTPNDMYMGLRYLGLWSHYRGPGKAKIHVPDDQAALAHGVYYLVKRKKRPHPLMEKGNGKMHKNRDWWMARFNLPL